MAVLERVDGFLAPDEERDHHVGKNDDVAQGQDGHDVRPRFTSPFFPSSPRKENMGAPYGSPFGWL